VPAAVAQAAAESAQEGALPRRPSTADLVARNRELEEEIVRLREEKLKKLSEVPRKEAEGQLFAGRPASDERPATSDGRPASDGRAATRLSTPRSGSDKHLRSTVQLGCFPATAFWGTEYQEEFNVLGKSMNLRIPGRKSDGASALSASLSARSRPSTPI
jgi:hypothetical protein